MKIYTKTGDAGETSLFDGTRVQQDRSARGRYGDVDEVQACARRGRRRRPDDQTRRACASRFSATCSRWARGWPTRRTGSPRASTKIVVADESIARLEGWIDRLEDEVPPLRHFILSGGSPAGAALHLARAVCRRAERAVLASAPTPSNRSSSSI